MTLGVRQHDGGRSSPARGTPWVLLASAGTAVCASAVLGFRLASFVVMVTTEVVFFAFFLRHFAFAIAALRTARTDLANPSAAVNDGALPSVSVLVACRDEESVIDGLLGSLCALDYPSDRIELIVVDDGSRDRTAELLTSWAALVPTLRVVRRSPGSTGGKSGALNTGLAYARGDVIVVFDADHQPRPDAVRRLASHFEDPAVAAVQGRCEVRNGPDSPLAQLVAVDYLAGYLVNEYGRQSLFQLPAYGGANCAVRASTLREVDGWNEDSVTEDTDLTLRLVLRGQRVRFDVNAVDTEEGVVTFRRYWRQRYRWARGHQQAWRDFRRAVWRSPRLSPVEKVETTMFLLAFHVPVLGSLGLGMVAISLSGIAQPSPLVETFVLWTLLFLGPLLELGSGLLVAGADRRRAGVIVLFLPVFFVSIALCTKAWFDGILGGSYAWVKTKRTGDASPAALGAGAGSA